MIYLSGMLPVDYDPPADKSVGLMLTYREGKGRKNPFELLDRVFWAADNNCFNDPNIDPAKYLDWLAGLAEARETCLFAPAPDVVGDAVETLKRSAGVLPAIRELGFPAALVAQDGIENLAVDWDSFDVLFIGGSTEWKLSPAAFHLCRRALNEGRTIHFGRVNSFRRLVMAQQAGALSADGTFVRFSPDVNIKHVENWVSAVRTQPFLNLDYQAA